RRGCSAWTICGSPPWAPATANTVTRRRPQPAHGVSYDRYSLSVDGEATFIRGGECHYVRLPSFETWRDVLEKYKAAS
ncbi:hypothetical protein, partial [Streptomyces sp. NPDC051098]|uniref:hypothetical protein n=1 Tax=Streptomyces sp. NPDC051098 TaxID=3155411 RepID=UPI00343CAFF4